MLCSFICLFFINFLLPHSSLASPSLSLFFLFHYSPISFPPINSIGFCCFKFISPKICSANLPLQLQSTPILLFLIHCFFYLLFMAKGNNSNGSQHCILYLYTQPYIYVCAIQNTKYRHIMYLHKYKFVGLVIFFLLSSLCHFEFCLLLIW